MHRNVRFIALGALFGLAACGDIAGDAAGGYGEFTSGGGDEPYQPADDDVSPPDTDGEPACDPEAPTTLFLSPDDSNSMSSPVQAREAVLGNFGTLGGVGFRPWEFFNYYTWDYPAPTETDLSLQAAMYRDPDADGDLYRMQIGVTSQAVPDADRPPVALTLVLDTSGSMGGSPMDMLKESCRAIASRLKLGDTVSVVTWNTSNATLLSAHAVQGPDDPTLLGIINALDAGGGTDLHGGLTAGYELANQVRVPGQVNRVVLISDGGANVGVTSADLIGANAGGEDEDGIYMVGIGVGTAGSYHDGLMDQVTDLGKGASVFVPSADEAWRVLADRFTSTFMVAARDVQVQVDLPPGFEIQRFSGEEYSEDPAEVEPQHISPSDSVVFHQTLETCAPELVTQETEVVVSVRYRDAVTFEARELSETFTFGELFAAPRAPLHKGAALLAYVDLLAAVRDGVDEAAAEAAARTWLQRALAAQPGDPDLLEIENVIDRL